MDDFKKQTFNSEWFREDALVGSTKRDKKILTKLSRTRLAREDKKEFDNIDLPEKEE